VTALFLFLCLAVWTGPVAASDTDEGVFLLMPGLELHLDAQGTISLVSAGGKQALIELGATDGASRDAVGRPGPGEAFTASTAEGAAHGLRGFSPGADDDQDGRVDEDRLDGRDNDGDGRVDEDFAAIGDRMSVWDRVEAGGTVHAELYHWFYDFLKSTVFLELDSGASRTFAFHSPLPWIPADVEARCARAQGGSVIRRTHAWISVFRDDRGRETWLGLKTLDDGIRLEPAGLGELHLPAGTSPVAVAVTAAATWDQLCSDLCAAEDVRRGVRDPMTGRSVPWMVGPAESLVSQEEAGTWTWRSGPGDGGELALEAPQGIARIPDIATLKLDSQTLPLPETVGLVTGGVEKTALISPEYRYQDLLRGRAAPDPLWEALPALDSRGAQGTLILRYLSPPLAVRSAAPGTELALEGRCLDGGRLRGSVKVEEPLVDPAGDGGRDHELDPSRELALSPELMLGWPNPFRDHLQIRCRIPATPQEAFAGGETGKDPLDADKTTIALPWGAGEPSVSVRIYSISGQELKTLFSGRQGAGEFVVQWDGTDNYGRPVASGPYLCKLQMDDLNLTRRFIYLR